MQKTLHILRFWLIPLISLVCTFFLPIGSPILLGMWIIAFLAVCEGGPSTAGVIRPAFWVGLHILPIIIQLVR